MVRLNPLLDPFQRSPAGAESGNGVTKEDSDQSRPLQQQLIEDISQMADGVEEQRLRQESKQEEMMDFIKEVMEKLEAAQSDQEELANALQTQRSNSGAAEQLGSFWEEVAALAADSAVDGQDTLERNWFWRRPSSPWNSLH